MSTMDSDWVKIGSFGVDSGLCWIGDPGYIDDGLEVTWPEFCREIDNREFKEFTQGVCVHSGFGDGEYDVFAKFVVVNGSDRRVAELRIVFITDQDAKDWEQDT